jgi:hypothetical protein
MKVPVLFLAACAFAPFLLGLDEEAGVKHDQNQYTELEADLGGAVAYVVPKDQTDKLSESARQQVLKIYSSKPLCCYRTCTDEQLYEILQRHRPRHCSNKNAPTLTDMVRDLYRMEQWCKACTLFKNNKLELMSAEELEVHLKALVVQAYDSRNTPIFRYKNVKKRFLALLEGRGVSWPGSGNNWGLTGVFKDPVLWTGVIFIGSSACLLTSAVNVIQGFLVAREKKDRSVTDNLQSYPYYSSIVETRMLKVGCAEEYYASQDTNFTVINNTLVEWPNTNEKRSAFCHAIEDLIIESMNNNNHTFKPLYPVHETEFMTPSILCYERLLDNASHYVDHSYWGNFSVLSPIRYTENPHLPQKGMSVQSIWAKIPDSFPDEPSVIHVSFIGYDKNCYIAHSMAQDNNALNDFMLDSHTSDRRDFPSNIFIARLCNAILFVGSVYAFIFIGLCV